MAVTYASFIAEYPEFSETGQTLVEAKIAQAVLETPSGTWGDWTDKGVMLRTAAALSIGPAGSNARIKGQIKTTYQMELERYERTVACGLGRVA